MWNKIASSFSTKRKSVFSSLLLLLLLGSRSLPPWQVRRGGNNGRHSKQQPKNLTKQKISKRTRFSFWFDFSWSCHRPKNIMDERCLNIFHFFIEINRRWKKETGPKLKNSNSRFLHHLEFLMCVCQSASLLMAAILKKKSSRRKKKCLHSNIQKVGQNK